MTNNGPNDLIGNSGKLAFVLNHVYSEPTGVVMKKFTVVMFVVFWFAGGLSAENWPQWRGPKLNSLSSETNLPRSFKDDNRLWRIELPGPGGASPVVWQEKIFVATVDGKDLALMCVSTDGQIEWKKKLEGKNARIRMDNGNSASCSPVTDGKHVWVMLADGILHCFSVDGDLKWKKNMQDEYGKFVIQFGMTSTPLLDNGKLYFQFIHGSMRNKQPSQGKLIALDASSGDEVWVHERDTPAVAENKHAYTTPTIFRNGSKEFLVVHGADYATGHSLKDGTELWRVGGFNPEETYNNFLRFVSSPVCTDSLIVIPSAKNGPVIGLSPDAKGKIEDQGDAVVWKMAKGTPDVATPVVSGSRVYLARENGVFICVDAESGEMQFEERLLRDRHRSTPVVADGVIYLIGRDGSACVLADSTEYKLISKTDLGEDTTASPAISNGRIYIRTNESLMAFGKK